MAVKLLQSKLSKANIGLLIICFIVVAIIFAINILNFKNLSNLQSSLDTLSAPRQSAIKLAMANENLSIAENEFRVFLLSGDSVAWKGFNHQIDSAILNLEQIQKTGDSSLLDSLISNVNAKVELAKSIAELKMGTDSLRNFITATRIKELSRKHITLKKMSTKILQDFYVVDTLKQVKTKKTFFKKLGSLFSNKEESANYQLAKGDTVNGGSDSSSVKENPKMKMLADSIQKYYQKSVDGQLKGMSLLNNKEKRLAETNLVIIGQMHNILHELVEKAKAIDKKRTIEAYETGINARQSIYKMSFISLIIIIIISGIVFYSASKSVQYEAAIIDAKTKAEKLAHTKARFLSNMSHEIRSPLTAIIGFTEQLETQETDENKLKQLRAIHSSSDHLLNTVNEILDFSKLDAGKLQIQKINFNLSKEIEETFYSCSVLAEKKKLAFNLTKQIDGNLFVYGDAHRLRQVLYNLISNALKFTEKGSVTVAAGVINTNATNILLKIDVTDTGVGIPKDQLNFIFEEFAQASTNRIDGRKAIKGTGLGLAISKMLMQLQGGDISVSSETGKGSTFSIKLPLELADNKTAVPATALLKETPGSYYAKKALVIEDNEINIMLLTLLLQKHNIVFDVAKDGETGLQLFKDNVYDIVLTDINVPKLTGDQLAAEIRKHTHTQKASIPIVALTASIISDDVELYRKTGINEVLMKPFKESEFKLILAKYLG